MALTLDCACVCDAVDMLKLVSSKRRLQTGVTGTAAVAPQCIMLYDGLMTFGRSYKADVKLMLPYVSRKHFTVSLHHGRTYNDTGLDLDLHLDLDLDPNY